MTTDEIYMQRCLHLAKLGAGNVAPNPLVGAVLVFNDRIIGEGSHMKYGEAHAEVNCIASVNKNDLALIDKSTLYVSLEPCSHFGKTPPCTDLILKNKIPQVVIGCKDVYKDVNGQGIERLKNAGVKVSVGILQIECLDLNKRFFTFHQKHRPYIILKWAQSANGKIGVENRRVCVSNEYTNRLVHKWRSEEASILIGTNTAAVDDPSLTTRFWKGNNPTRLVIDMKLRLSPGLKFFNREVKTIIFNLDKSEDDGNLVFYRVEKENFLESLVDALYRSNIQSVIIEGGGRLLQSFIDAGLWDEARVITNHGLVIENGISSPDLSNGIVTRQERYLNDTIDFLQHAS